MPNYQKTKRACYMGFITQAIAANFAPLLFLKFHTDYHISLGNIALISTCFFKIFGIENWKILACVWAIIPIVNGLIFTKAPIAPLVEEGETGMTILDLCREKMFWILLLMMVCAGASEQE